MCRDAMRHAFGVVAGSKIQSAFPQKTAVRGVVHAERKLRETAASYAKASREDPCGGATGRRTVILDVEFVGLRRKHFSGLRIIGLNRDERSVFVLKAESGCHDGVRSRNC